MNGGFKWVSPRRRSASSFNAGTAVLHTSPRRQTPPAGTTRSDDTEIQFRLPSISLKNRQCGGVICDVHARGLDAPRTYCSSPAPVARGGRAADAILTSVNTGRSSAKLKARRHGNNFTDRRNQSPVQGTITRHRRRIARRRTGKITRITILRRLYRPHCLNVTDKALIPATFNTVIFPVRPPTIQNAPTVTAVVGSHASGTR